MNFILKSLWFTVNTMILFIYFNINIESHQLSEGKVFSNKINVNKVVVDTIVFTSQDQLYKIGFVKKLDAYKVIFQKKAELNQLIPKSKFDSLHILLKLNRDIDSLFKIYKIDSNEILPFEKNPEMEGFNLHFTKLLDTNTQIYLYNHYNTCFVTKIQDSIYWKQKTPIDFFKSMKIKLKYSICEIYIFAHENWIKWEHVKYLIKKISSKVRTAYLWNILYSKAPERNSTEGQIALSLIKGYITKRFPPLKCAFGEEEKQEIIKWYNEEKRKHKNNDEE